MAKLLFFDTNHTYKLDGEVIPSVSEVLRFLSREVYGDINQYTLDKACTRGTEIHKATEILDTYNKVECMNDEIVPYINAYVKWRKENGIKQENIVEIERPYGDAELGYAGTLDRVLKYDDGTYAIMDIKSSSKPQPRLWQPAINAYKALWEKAHDGEQITKLFDLQLKNDGTYTVHEVPIDFSVFSACLTLHKHMASKRKRGKKQE